MLELKEVTIEDREWTTQLMRASGFRGSEYTFANLFNWASTYTVRIGRVEDYLIVRSGKMTHNYLYPAGRGDVTIAISAMEEAAKREEMPFCIYGISAQSKEELERLYPGRFTFRPTRDTFDYIYLRESLDTLAGKKLHGKRNHIARFKENHPGWSYESITEQNIQDTWKMNVEWCRINGCHESHGLQREACAVRSAFEHYWQLGLTGGLLRDGDGRVLAFTFGSPVTDDTFVVHVEKAFADVQGAYPMINQQFVQNELGAYTYVNREDDTGDEGLRRAKESYRPAFLYERYAASENQQR